MCHTFGTRHEKAYTPRDLVRLKHKYSTSAIPDLARLAEYAKIGPIACSQPKYHPRAISYKRWLRWSLVRAPSIAVKTCFFERPRSLGDYGWMQQ